MENLNKERNMAFVCACQHGWHEMNYDDEHYLMLIITEVAEAVEADRNDEHACRKSFEKRLTEDDSELNFYRTFKEYIKDSVEDELADVVIRSLDLAGLRNIDLIFEKSASLSMMELGAETEAKIKLFPEWCYSLCDILTKDISLELKLRETIVYVMTYCRINHIDIAWHIEQKMKFNQPRPYKHDKKY